MRNLVVSLGTWNQRPLPGVRTIELRRLRALAIEPYTGHATLEIALGVEHAAGTTRAFAGGTIRLDLVAALASARRSGTLLRRGPYVGPDAVLIDTAELV
ncbi:MAG: hypothetical protein NT062_22775 [Proteobacteria bacterium]|nr:hypothetical protein [Pseudomonadota bacterium]